MRIHRLTTATGRANYYRKTPGGNTACPPASNANYAWLQHMIYHLSPKGIMALVLANGSLSSNTGGEGDIRKAIVEADLVDCIVALPKQLFYNTGIPACLWFISRKKSGNGNRKRAGEILFIDASQIGYMIDRVHRAFTDEDITKITDTYHGWRGKNVKYKDVKGFCKSATLEEIKKHNLLIAANAVVFLSFVAKWVEHGPIILQGFNFTSSGLRNYNWENQARGFKQCYETCVRRNLDIFLTHYNDRLDFIPVKVPDNSLYL